MTRLILCFLFFFGVFSDAPSGHPVHAPLAQSEPEAMLGEVVMALYHFDFRLAEVRHAALKEAYPEHYLTGFSDVFQNWWRMISWPRPGELETRYRQSILHALSLARPAVEQDPSDQEVFFFINLHAMLARLDLQQGAWVRTLGNLRKCVEQVEWSMGREAAFGGFYLTTGLYNYLTAEAARRFPLLRPYTLFYPKGDRELGLAQLEKAFASGHPMWRTEAAYFLMRIYLDQENDAARSERFARWLTTGYPENLIFQYYHLLALQALNKADAVSVKKAEIRRRALENPGLSPEQRKYFLDLVSAP